MPIDSNPFASDPIKAEIFEQGYLFGFMDPDSNDFRPLAPDLLEVFQQGFQSGRTDRSAPPVGDQTCRWLTAAEVETLHESGALPESIEHAIVFLACHAADHIFKDFSGTRISPFPWIDVFIFTQGLTDVQLQEVPPDFRAMFNLPENDPSIHYAVMCPRTDHDNTTAGVTTDGYFVGPNHNNLFDAANDMNAHGHHEAFVARCNLNDNTCGIVWLAGSQ